MDWSAVLLSLRLSAMTTLILLIAGIPLAAWIAFSPRRITSVVEAVVALPIVLPPTVLGFYILVALGPRSPFGKLYESITGQILPFTFRGLLIASVLYSLPFAVQPIRAAFGGIDRDLVEASWCLGAGRFRTLLRVVVPLGLPGIVTGIVLSFAHTLGEFGVVLMVGGNLPGETRTVAISIYDDVQALNYVAAGRTAFALLVFSFIVLVVTYSVQRKAPTAWP